jgi:hypothetical protein
VIEVRSFRRVFELERRLYSIDRLRLNPGGVPIRGVVYALAAVVAAAVAGWLPVIGAAQRATPWFVGQLLVPCAVATAMALIRIDGRPFHLAATAQLRMTVTPRRITRLGCRSRVGGRWAPPQLLLLPDGSEARFRRLAYCGPGAVLVRLHHDRVLARGSMPERIRRSVPLRLIERADARRPGRGDVVVLARGARLVVEPSIEVQR